MRRNIGHTHTHTRLKLIRHVGAIDAAGARTRCVVACRRQFPLRRRRVSAAVVVLRLGRYQLADEPRATRGVTD